MGLSPAVFVPSRGHARVSGGPAVEADDLIDLAPELVGLVFNPRPAEPLGADRLPDAARVGNGLFNQFVGRVLATKPGEGEHQFARGGGYLVEQFGRQRVRGEPRLGDKLGQTRREGCERGV